MEKFAGEFLVESDLKSSSMKYKVIDSIEDFEKECQCIIVKSLSPDYSLLLGSLKLIIAEAGSQLSHLAIVGREHNVPIILVEDIISRIPKSGALSVKGNMIEVEK